MSALVRESERGAAPCNVLRSCPSTKRKQLDVILHSCGPALILEPRVYHMSALWCQCHSWWARVSGSGSGQGEFTNNWCGVLIRPRHFSGPPLPAQHFGLFSTLQAPSANHQRASWWAFSDGFLCGVPTWCPDSSLEWNVRKNATGCAGRADARSFFHVWAEKEPLTYFKLGKKGEKIESPFLRRQAVKPLKGRHKLLALSPLWRDVFQLWECDSAPC